MKQKNQQRPSGVKQEVHHDRSWRSLPPPSSCVHATGVDRCVGGVRASEHPVVAASGPYTGLQHHLTAGCRSALPPVAPSLWCFFINLASSSSAFALSLSLPLCQCLVSSMILVLIIISLSLNSSGLKSRASDGVSKTCVLSCVQQGATPL